MEKSSNKTVILLLIVIIVILAVLCALFATDTISFNTNTKTDNKQTNENNQVNNNNQTNDNNVIKTKLVDNLNDRDSETTFNGITVKVKQNIEDMICNVSSFTINGYDVSKDNASCVKSYEFYDNNVIIMSSHTSGTVFTIYNVTSNSTIVKFSSGESSLEGYFVESYSTNGNIITINAIGCGAQCGKENAGEKAIFEIEYTNNKFSSPKLINKTLE